MNYTKGEWKVTNTAFERWSSYRGKSTGARAFVTVDMNEVAEAQGDVAEEAEANAHLISAAPEMYEALKSQHQAIDILFAMLIERDKAFFPSKSGKPWKAIIQGNKALAKAEGREE